MNDAVPDIDALKRLDGTGFARAVCNSLGRHGMKTPGFNLAAEAGNLLPPLGKMFFYPAEAHGLISSGLKALREYDRGGDVSAATREEFILADVADLVRNTDTQAQDRAMDYVASKMTGISSLALISPRAKR